MPRNAQGQYFLPDGNPVTPGELIKSEWANSTMDDIANALTNSLDRAGAGGMTGQFKAAAGTTARPGISFAEDVTSGLQKKSAGVVSAVASGIEQAYWTSNGFFLVSPPSDAMEAANKSYVDALAAQATKIVGEFGQSKTPSQLPTNGYIPVNWDATGVPAYAIQLSQGQSMVYRPANTADPLYDHVYVYVGTNFIASAWIDIGPVEGPPGPQGETGPQGPQGPEGPTGPQGPTGQTGAIGPQGPQGIQGNTGQQGPQGPAGQAAVLVGAFGASKTPAQLPPDGFIPANWDSPGNPATDRQMQVGQALVYSDCPVGTPNYGHVYSYVGIGFDANGWVDAGDIVGPAGPQGPQGPQGATGPQGPAGADGAQGPEGPQGIQGPAGPQGTQGPKGDQGVAGPPNTLVVGSVTETTGAPTVTITGASPTQTIDFALKTGAQGPQGPQGDTGPQGATGATGPQGPQGPAGPAGVGGMNGQTFTSSGTFTIPDGVNMVKITAVGGGGNGGYAANPGGTNSAAGGGGGGGTVIGWRTGLTPGLTLTVTVGGATQASSVSSGTQSIAAISATAGANGAGAQGAGGAGGVGQGGSLSLFGGNGGDAGPNSSAAAIAGGGGVTYFGIVQVPTGPKGGSPGADGKLYGGGGQGGGSSYNQGWPGGAGAAGVVIIEW